MLSPFMSFSTEVQQALQFPIDGCAKAGEVAVLVQLDSVSRSPIHEFSPFASESEVLLPPCQIVRVVRASRSGAHGRAEVELQDLQIAYNIEFPTRSAGLSPCPSPPPAQPLNAVFQLMGSSKKKMKSVPASASVGEVVMMVSKSVGLDLDSLWDGDVELDAGDAFAPLFVPEKIYLVRQRPAVAPRIVEVLDDEASVDVEACCEGDDAEVFREEADLGDPAAQSEYARCLVDGVGVKADLAEAARYASLAAAEGDALGHAVFARCLRKTKGDPAQAAFHARTAAKAENLYGLAEWGLCLVFGVGVARDEAAGAELLKRSADGGCPWGVNGYGVCVFNGLGVRRSGPVSARKSRAATVG
jgi:hypothetical protein